MTTNASLLIDGNRGVYIPQLFAQSYSHYVTNKQDLSEYLNDLKNGPDDPFYWDAWETIMRDAILVDDKGRERTLYQDGDLWAIPVDELDQIPEL